MTFDIEGTVVLVTGGQRGLGAAFAAELLRRRAAHVVVTARQPAATDDARLIPLPLDVTDDASVAALAETVPEVDLLINNAGVILPGPLLTAPLEEVRATFDANVLGPLRMARAFAPALAARGGGALVDVHSVLSWLGGVGAYGASKAALWSVTNTLRLELADQGTTVTGVHLGFADTAMSARVRAPKVAPAEVARLVLDGVERGDAEVLVDEVSRRAKAALAGPVEALTIAGVAASA